MTKRREVQIKELDRPWQWEEEDILNVFDIDPEQGLSSGDLKNQRKRYGKNRVQSKDHKSAWLILLEQFKSIIVWLLTASAALSFAYGKWVDGSAMLWCRIFTCGGQS